MKKPWWEIVEEDRLELTPILTPSSRKTGKPLLACWMAARRSLLPSGGSYAPNHMVALGTTPEDAVVALVTGDTQYGLLKEDTGDSVYLARNYDAKDKEHFITLARKKEREDVRKNKDKPGEHGRGKGVAHRRQVG